METTGSFFVVWNPAHGLPRYQHGTLAQAKAEAERLARLNPGSEFIVMQSLGSARVNDIAWTQHDDIPF